MSDILEDKKFMEITDTIKDELKVFCKRTANRCQDKSYSWEDFFQIGLFAAWQQFAIDKSPKLPKFYLNRARWAIYDELDKINADKRDESKQIYDTDTGCFYITNNE